LVLVSEPVLTLALVLVPEPVLALVSALVVDSSVLFDLPTGTTIVVTFSGVLIVMLVIHLVLIYGSKIHSRRGATSLDRPLERV